jgi:threonine aldolase
VGLVRRARRLRKLFGGGMRQAGILAAAGLFALEHHVERLAEDHARARRLAEGVALLPGVEVAAPPETNMVLCEVDRAADFVEALSAEGVRVGAVGPRTLRLVTHLDVDDAGVERAIAAFGRVAGPLA